MDIPSLIQILIFGLAVGSGYAIASIGMALLFGVLRVFNVAHGWFVVFGSYVAYWLFTLYGIDPLFSIVIVFILLSIIGMGYYMVALRPVQEKALLAQIVTTFAFALILDNLMTIFWTADPKIATPSYSTASLSLGPVNIPFVYLISLGFTAIITSILHLVLTRTITGKKIRAAADCWDGAKIVGISVYKVCTLTSALCLGLAGAAGSILSMINPFYPSMGLIYQLDTFVILVCAGVGKLKNILLAGFLIGEIGALTSLVSPTLSSAMGLLVLIIILSIRAIKKEYS